MHKLKKLKTILEKMPSVLIAFSGGVDSCLLLKIAADTLGKNVLAVTAVSETYPLEELIFAKKMARLLKVRHETIRTSEIKNKNFFSNPSNRCYFCKKELFRRLKHIAHQHKINFVLDASNLSDKKDFRPGNQAKKEFKVRSPLAEAGLTKDDIRRISKKLGLVTWDKPAQACLASRIPYGTKISTQLLRKINLAESFLKKEGFNQVRLRHYNIGLCRIEILKNEFPLFFKKSNKVVEKLKKLGYNYITLDLEGYRSGSLNEVIKQ